jgi:hypothetical protein
MILLPLGACSLGHHDEPASSAVSRSADLMPLVPMILYAGLRKSRLEEIHLIGRASPHAHEDDPLAVAISGAGNSITPVRVTAHFVCRECLILEIALAGKSASLCHHGKPVRAIAKQPTPL